MIDKVIYIGYQPLTEKVVEDFYFNELIKNQIKVEYWDLTKIFFQIKLNDLIKSENIKKIHSYDELEELLKEQDDKRTVIISQMSFEYRLLKFFKIISKYNFKLGFFARGGIPIYSTESQKLNIINKFKRVFKYSTLINFIKNRYTILLKKYNIIKPYSFVFTAGTNGIQTIGHGYWIEKNSSKIVKLNSFDYDKYITSFDLENIIKEKYCVYLDEYLPFHPDFDLLNITKIEHSVFYNLLNNFFDNIEKKYDIKVIIAAHPKSEKYKEFNYFNGRKVLFDSTSLLVKDAEFVIGHCSTSINFAILNCKPVITVLTNDLIRVMKDYSTFISNFSKNIDSQLLNIDETFESEFEVKPINYNKYKDYKYNYLTSIESENHKSSDIFLNTLSSI